MPTKLKNLSPKDQTYWFIGFVEGYWEIDSKTVDLNLLSNNHNFIN